MTSAPEDGTLTLLRDALLADRERFERWGDSYDTRAGLVLGFAGVLVGLANGSSVLARLGQGASVLAGATALYTLWPLSKPFVSGSRFLRKYGRAPFAIVDKALTDTIAVSNDEYLAFL